MRRFAIAAAALVAGGPAITSYAQPSDSDRVTVDVDACVDLETREEQLECYEDRVNEVLRAREAESNTSQQAETTVSSTAAEPVPSRASRRAERRAASEAEQRQREAERRQREAAELAAEAAAAADAAAEATAAADDPNYTAGEIVARITALREMEPNAFIISLDNGQVWRQNSPKRYLLRIGAEVRLRPGRMGPSYRLTDPEVGNYIQVRRIQ